MSSRDKYGHYVNDKGVTFDFSTDKRGNDHFNFYEGPVDDNHSAFHVDVNYGTGSVHTHFHNEDRSENESDDWKFF